MYKESEHRIKTLVMELFNHNVNTKLSRLSQRMFVPPLATLQTVDVTAYTRKRGTNDNYTNVTVSVFIIRDL